MTTQPYPTPPVYQAAPPEKRGLAVASMVIGIVAIVLSFIPVIGFLSFILGPIAVILGIVALIKKRGKGQAITGVITGALGFVIVTIGSLIFGAAVLSIDEEMQNTESSATEEAEVTEDEDPEEVAEEVERTEEELAEAVEADTPDTNSGQDNALSSAESYLNFSGFSRSGLITQLEFEGYSSEDAEYAVDNIDVDWNEQAVRSAESYLSSMSFSLDALIEQLVFEGYTQEQAEYGANQAY